MERNLKKLAQQILTGGATKDTLLTAAQTTIIRHIRVVNYSVANATITLWHDGIANSNYILPPATVLAGGWAEFDGEFYMEKGDTLTALGSAATSLTVSVYGEVLA